MMRWVGLKQSCCPARYFSVLGGRGGQEEQSSVGVAGVVCPAGSPAEVAGAALAPHFPTKKGVLKPFFIICLFFNCCCPGVEEEGVLPCLAPC